MGINDLPTQSVDNNEVPIPTQLDDSHRGSLNATLSPLYPKERLIIQQLVRHGERIIYHDDESGQSYTAAEFVAADLNGDEIALSTPLFAQVLDELLQHIGDEGFSAERYFVTHANPQISRLAVDLVEEKYQLSKYHSKTQTVIDEADHLVDIIPHLLNDYKLAIVEIDLKRTLDQLRQPSIMNDPAQCMEVMTRYKQLTELKHQMAKMLGDRVIG